MAKKNKQNRQNQIPSQVKPPIEKSPEMLVLEQKIAELADKKQTFQNRKSKLEKEKRFAETELSKAEKEQEQADKELNRLQQEAFEIREAIRKIGELKLAENTEEAQTEILSILLGSKTNNQAKNSQNDDAILAVAARYKMNDVLLYSEDKNLKNKATSIGIKSV